MSNSDVAPDPRPSHKDWDKETMAKDFMFQYLMAMCCGEPGSIKHEGQVVHGYAYKTFFFFSRRKQKKTGTQPPDEKSGEV